MVSVYSRCKDPEIFETHTKHKIKMTRFLKYFSLLLILSLGACREDSIIDLTEPGPIDVAKIIVEATIHGNVVDQNGIALEGVDIEIEGVSTTTDDLGYFYLETETERNKIVVKARHPSYFDATPVVSMQTAGTMQIRIQMQEKMQTGSFSASAGGKVTHRTGSSVEFAPDGVKTANGTNYTGEVNVYMNYIDPTAPELVEIMSGNLTALNDEDNLRVLQSYGMVDVLLESPSGEELQPTRTATLTVAVPQEIAASAPAEIPLWHFDTESGLWIEEGSARLEGDVYVGEVTHFSLWNCDIDNDPTYLCGSIISFSTGLWSQYKIKVTILSNGWTNYTYFDETGKFCGWVPSGEVLLLEIFDDCGELVYSDEIGPFEPGDQEIFIDPSQINGSSEEVTISGSVVDCDGMPVTDGRVFISNVDAPSSAVSLAIDADGSFSASLLSCGSTNFEYFAIDLAANLRSETFTVEVTDEAEVGVITACDGEWANVAYFQLIDQGGEIVNLEFESFETRIDSGDIRSFIFVVNDNQSNGSIVQYRFWILDWDDDLQTNDFELSYEIIITGEPTRVIKPLQSGNNDRMSYDRERSLITDYLPGSPIQFVFSGGLLDDVSGTDIDLGFGRLYLATIIE